MDTDPEIKVTQINGRWHCRLWFNNKVHSEMVCDLREDIGYICHELLRWFDKLGGTSHYADRARHRKPITGPIGRVAWIKN